VSTVRVHAGVDQFKLWVTFLHNFFNLLPINLKLFILLYFGIVRYNYGVVEVLLCENNFSILVVLVFLHIIRFFLLVSLLVTFAVACWSRFFWEGFISDASNCVTFNLEFG